MSAASIELPTGINFLNTIPQAMKATARSRSGIYEMIAAGELKAVKDGARTLITGESIVERSRRLPSAAIGRLSPKAA